MDGFMRGTKIGDYSASDLLNNYHFDINTYIFSVNIFYGLSVNEPDDIISRKLTDEVMAKGFDATATATQYENGNYDVLFNTNKSMTFKNFIDSFIQAFGYNNELLEHVFMVNRNTKIL